MVNGMVKVARTIARGVYSYNALFYTPGFTNGSTFSKASGG